MRDGHALAHAVHAARPSGVHQPHPGPVVRQAFAKHVCVRHWRKGQEGFAEATRKCRLGGGQANLGSRNLGGVPAQEVVEGLRGGQSRYRGEYPKGVTGKQQHMGRMSTNAIGTRVGDEIQWIGPTRVLGLRLAIQVQDMRGRIVDDVFQDRPELMRRREDLGFGRRRQVDDLGVAPTLEVE